MEKKFHFGETLNKSDLVRELAKRSDIDYRLADYVFHNLLDIMHERLKQGYRIYLYNIGSFRFVYQAKEKISNLTGKVIPRHWTMKFKFNSELARYIRVMSREL